MATSTENKACIFIIDDDPPLLSLLRLIFDDADFEVHSYSDPLRALEEVPQLGPKAIILDLEMPLMSGRAFFRELRDHGDHTPVLILSAHGARRAQQELGADAYVDKPFEPDELVQVARRLVSTA